MGCFYNIYIFKGCGKAAFRSALSTCATKLGGTIVLDNMNRMNRDRHLRTSSVDSTHTLLMERESYPFIKALQECLGLPNIAIRIVDECWGYTLYSGSTAIDQFITNPWSLDDSEEFIEKHAGNADVLAKTWDIPEARIEKYLRHDDESLSDTKAYPDDRHDYLECEQYWDFLTALGGVEPQTEFHQLNLPMR